jgi:putative transposase
VPRPLRIEYQGARYHVVSRGDHREDIVNDDRDRTTFVRTLGEACQKTGWQVHAYCLMTNHFHLVIETPQPNLAVGMKWMLGTYTQRFNLRHRHWGHLFGGRYKAQPIDERSPSYLLRACNYTHLNPARAGMIGPEKPLQTYPWSSYPAYLESHLRAAWLRVDRLLGEHGLQEDTALSRREFERRTEQERMTGAIDGAEVIRSAWRIGAEDFSDWLAEKLGRRGHAGECANERNDTDTARAEAIVREGLLLTGWTEDDLSLKAKGDAIKIKLARQLRTNTPMSRAWIANRLKMGSASYVSALLKSVDSKL